MRSLDSSSHLEGTSPKCGPLGDPAQSSALRVRLDPEQRSDFLPFVQGTPLARQWHPGNLSRAVTNEKPGPNVASHPGQDRRQVMYSAGPPSRRQPIDLPAAIWPQRIEEAVM